MRWFGSAALLASIACGGGKVGSTAGGATGASTGLATTGIGAGSTGTSGAVASSGASSGSASASSGAGTGTTSGFVPAMHAQFPQVPNGSGGVIAAPKIVTITFPDEDYDLSGFADWFVGSDYLAAVGKDYGVGLGSHLANYVSTDVQPGTVDDSQIQSFLSSNAGSAFPAPDSDTIYLLAYPPGTTITNSTIGGKSCENFGAYHWAFSSGSDRFVYAVVPTCDAGESKVGYSYSVAASHEVMEAATDPTGSGSWVLPGGVWTLLGTEVADLCEGQYFQSDAGYLVQRIWSNSAAAAGNTSPCIPFPPGGVYFNVTAEATSGANGDFSAVVASSSAAQTITFDLTPWSTAPVSFSVELQLAEGSVSAVNLPTTNNQPPVLENGVVQPMKITLPAGESKTDVGIILLLSDDNFQTQTLAPLLIQVQ